MRKYIINWMRFVIEYLPSIMRTNIVDLFYVLLRGIRDTWFRFGEHIKETDRVLSYNGQYPNLQRLLNDELDNTTRRIEVRDGEMKTGRLLVYPNAEHKPLSIPFAVYPATKYGGYEGFTVELPSDIFNDVDKMNKIIRLLETYKFAGTKYNIIKK